MRKFTKFVSEVINSKFYNTLPLPIRYMEKWKFCIWQCPLFAESNRAVRKSMKMALFITILLGAYSSLRLVLAPINYTWLNSHTIVLCFLDSADAQFRLFVPACLLKYYFFKLPLRLFF